MTKFFEDYTPLIVTVLVTAILNHYVGQISDISSVIKDMASNSLSLCGVLLGFLLTITTMMHTVASRRMKFVRDAGAYDRIVLWLHRAIYYDIIALICSLVLIVIPKVAFFAAYLHGMFVAFSALVLYSISLSVRFSIFFIRLLADPTPAE